MKLLIQALNVAAWLAVALGLMQMVACDGGERLLLAEEVAVAPVAVAAAVAARTSEAEVAKTGPARPRSSRLWWRVSTGALGGPV